MKPLLKVSIALNVILASALVFLWSHPRTQEADPAPPISAMTEPSGQAAAQSATPLAHKEAAAQPFRWSQLLAGGNYQAYVANLRAAGCPEPTVEDIVRGDAERAFFAKRSALGIDGTEPGPWSGQAQMQLVASLLGQTPAIAKEPVASSPNLQATEAATMAAFLKSVDLTAQAQNDEQKREIAGLRQGLMEQISGANQAPNDAASPTAAPALNSAQSLAGGSSGTQSPTSTATTPSSQTVANTPQSSQASVEGSTTSWRPPVNQSLLQAAQAESILGGLYGMGAAIQYEQYRITQAAQQQP